MRRSNYDEPHKNETSQHDSRNPEDLQKLRNIALKRTAKRDKKANMFKILFEQFVGTKKEFSKIHNINYSTMKGYLRK